MQFLVNLLGAHRFNWIDLMCIFLFGDLVTKGHWILALVVLVIGTLLSFAANSHAETDRA